MQTFTFRLPVTLSRKMRALAVVYDATPGEFVRDLIESTVEEGLHKKLFEKRLKDGLKRYKNKDVKVKGPNGGAWVLQKR